MSNIVGTEAAGVEGVRLVRGILPHVSDCDGLSIMIERLPESNIRAVLDSRDGALRDGHDLITWAERIRARRPVPPREPDGAVA